VISGLTPNTSYHYRLVATNSAALFGGTTYGSNMVFTTDPDPPAVVTGDATSLSNSGAILVGVVFPNGRTTGVYFDYGLTTAYNLRTPTQTIPGDAGVVNIFGPVTDLVANATYHFRIVASNSGSSLPSLGADKTFQAKPPAPSVITGGAVSLTTTSARLSATVRARNAETQAFFDYGTNGVTFPYSVSASPTMVDGDTATPVSAAITNLLQGVTYSFRIRAVNIGGEATGATAQFALDILSGLNRVFPGTPPEAQGFVLVTLVPSGINSGWRFVGEQQWRPSGLPVGGLTTGDRQIEYRPVPGYIQPLRESISVISGASATLIRAEYFPTPGAATGSLNVLLKPDGLAAASVPVAQRAQWRLLGEGDTQWRDGGTTLTGLRAGTYLVECKPVAGRSAPSPVAVTLTAGQSGSVVATYYLAESAGGAVPTVVPFDNVSSNSALPYAYVGQIRSDAGSGSGFVVKPRVVATAAHVVFDDGTLSYATNLQWLFQRDRGTYEPKPLVPRGVYVFTGYAARRTLDNTPGVSSPESQDRDAAAIYFTEDAGRGGSGGYLASDLANNEFLLSAKPKLLVGYPVDGIAALNQGRMHATPPTNVAFAAAFGKTFTTAGIRSSGGNSGGPLCVQADNGNYYPAAIYLGGSAQTVVRAIDSEVIDLFNRAEVSANGGANNTGGGITQVNAAVTGPNFLAASITVNIGPSAVTGVARWGLGSTPQFTSGNQVNNLSPESYTVNFSDVAGFLTPPSVVVTATAGQLLPISATYSSSRSSLG
jgi:hypothetical protein